MKKTHCRYCDQKLPEAFLDLGLSPLANSFVPADHVPAEEFKCPLALTHCENCGLVQLTHAVPADLMFKNYLYVSSTTKTFQTHFAEYAAAVRAKLPGAEKPLVVDIGSNDGLLLSCYEREGLRAVGVDPAENLAAEANQQGRETVNRYFDGEAVRLIKAKYGPAHAISANNVFAHIDDIQSVCRNVAELLDESGFFVIEFPYLGVMLEDLVFDMIYHEHVSYIALGPLAFLCAKFGMKIFDVQKVASHGGSFRVFIQKENGPHQTDPVVGQILRQEKEKGFSRPETYAEFARRVMEVKSKMRAFVSRIKASGKSIAGYGAPAKATTIINFCEFDSREIDYIVDDNPLKQNHLVPGAGIPVLPGTALNARTPDYVIIFAWNFAKEILQKTAALAEQGVKFIVPLPEPREIAPQIVRV